MTFIDRLNGTAEEIETGLAALLRQHAAAGAPERLVAAMRHAVLGGGKRLRPYLLVESARVFGVPAERSLWAGLAVELVHGYSLVHDDLPAMDNDRLRRGQPTVWAAFDEWTAILAGDGLLTLAFEVLADPGLDVDPNVRCEIVRELALAAGGAGMVGGQAIDLAADKLRQPASPTLDHVRRLQAMKTGALIRFSAEAGAILGRAAPRERAAMRHYGEALGLAFQIADDLLDAEGTEAEVGKAVGKDAAAGKATLVSLLGIEASRAELERARHAAELALEPFGARAFPLRACAEFVAHRKS
ncbi:MAG: polyprenyl synthetase family protein [Hyphomicrobiaceae bacterium]|nr:polyprenyl synthetase family protein [Hyphomicrobiaceae bacterium]